MKIENFKRAKEIEKEIAELSECKREASFYFGNGKDIDIYLVSANGNKVLLERRGLKGQATHIYNNYIFNMNQLIYNLEKEFGEL